MQQSSQQRRGPSKLIVYFTSEQNMPLTYGLRSNGIISQSQFCKAEKNCERYPVAAAAVDPQSLPPRRTPAAAASSDQ
jgi:hypothetical protein